MKIVMLATAMMLGFTGSVAADPVKPRIWAGKMQVGMLLKICRSPKPTSMRLCAGTILGIVETLSSLAVRDDHRVCLPIHMAPGRTYFSILRYLNRFRTKSQLSLSAVLVINLHLFLKGWQCNKYKRRKPKRPETKG